VRPTDITLLPQWTEEDAYLYHLGGFIEGYAQFESALFVFLYKSADMSVEAARALLSGANVDQKMGWVRRLWRAGLTPPKEIQDEVVEVFEHAKAITTVRNSMLHYGSFFSPERGRLTTDQIRAITASEAKEHRVHAPLLVQMRMDITKCASHLMSLVFSYASLDVRIAENGGDQSPLKRAWLYTPEPSQPRKVRTPKSRHPKQP
jgi:hypothetical protein